MQGVTNIQSENISSLDRFIQLPHVRALEHSFNFDVPGSESESLYQNYLKKELLQKKLKNFPIKSRSKSKEFSMLGNFGFKQIIKRKTNVKHSFRQMHLRNIVDDFYLNLLDWSSDNIIGIGLRRSLYGWPAFSEKPSIICKLPHGTQICSVKFNSQNEISVGDSKGHISIYDIQKNKNFATLEGHLGRVSSLDWNNNLLLSGAKDGYISIWDQRILKKVHFYKAHNQEISGLKWNQCGSLIASGGNDNRLLIYQMRASKELIKFTNHKAAIKAVDWCPQNSSIVAAGGGTNDKHIRFFNSKTLQHEFSIDTGSQICNLSFSRSSNQMVTTHGYSLNHISVWRSSTLWSQKQQIQQVCIMRGHSSRILYLASSPSGRTLVTAAGDQTVRFWHPYQYQDHDGFCMQIR